MIGENKLATYFCGTTKGAWAVTSIQAIKGEILPAVSHIQILNSFQNIEDKLWTLAGVSGHARYTTRTEKIDLSKIQAPLARPEAICASLIPIKKSDDWWALSQDERRQIFEDQSKHVAHSMKYLPAIARKLYHSRDLDQPFDFLTWFEFSPEHEKDFNHLLLELRASEEWKYVSREVDIRLKKDPIKL